MRAILALALLAASLAGCATTEEAREPTGEASVRMIENAYRAEVLEVAVGTRVTWTNDDAVLHTVTPTDADAWGTRGSGDEMADWLPQGGTWSHTFWAAGEYRYFCIPHAYEQDGVWTGMVGTVVVAQ